MATWTPSRKKKRKVRTLFVCLSIIFLKFYCSHFGICDIVLLERICTGRLFRRQRHCATRNTRVPTRSGRVLGVSILTWSVLAAKEERRSSYQRNICHEHSNVMRTGADVACTARLLRRERRVLVVLQPSLILAALKELEWREDLDNCWLLIFNMI